MILVAEPDLARSWLESPQEAEARDRALLSELPDGVVERTAEQAIRVCGELDELWAWAQRVTDERRRVALHVGPVARRVDPLTDRETVVGPAALRLSQVLQATPLGSIGLSAEAHERLGSPPSAPLLGVPDAVVLFSRTTPELPRRLGPLLGRANELQTVLDRMTRHRWITLVGPGGIGKSRLALEVAHERSAVWVEVPNGPIRSEISAAVGAREAGLGQVLADRGPMVLVVDEAEHAVDAVRDLLEELLAVAPGLRVVATSRRPLGAAVERVVELPPLDVGAAVQLLTERNPELDPDVARQVAEAVDRLPLALELVAARASKLDDEALLAAVRQVMARGMAPVIQGSWDALSSEQRRGLVALTAFVGPFSDAAGRAVIGEESVLDALIEHSLVARRGERYALLDSVRMFASERGDRTEGLERHAAWFARDVPPRVWRPEDWRARTRRLQRDHAELLAVTERFEDERGARALLAVYSWAVTHLNREWLVERLEAMEQTAGDPVLAARLRAARGAVVRSIGDRDQARKLLDQAAEILEREGAEHAAAVAWMDSARCLGDQWAEDEANERHHKVLELASRVGDDGLAASAWIGIGRSEVRRSDPRCHDRLALAIELAEQAGDDRQKGWALLVGSRMRVSGGDVDQALADVALATELYGRYDDAESTSSALNYEALARIDAGQFDRAAACAERAIRLCREAGNPYLELHCRSALGFALVLGGRADRAVVVLEHAAVRAARLRLDGLVATLQGDLGLALADLGRPEAVDQLLASASAWAGLDSPMTAALYRRYAAAAAALAGDVERGRSLWDSDARGTEEVAQLWGAIEPDPAVLAAEKERWGEGMVDPDLRLAVRWHARRIAEVSPAVTVFREGKVRLQDGSEIDLSRRQAPRRILLYLASRRVEDPGGSATLDQLVSVGWPGERIVAAAASNRAYVAVATLRREGLADLLQSGPDGYRFDPAVPLNIGA